MPAYVLGMLHHPLCCLLVLTWSIPQYATDVAQMQWTNEFSAVQHAELRELEDMKKLIIGLSGNVDAIGKSNEQVKDMVSQVDQKLQKVLEEKSEVRLTLLYF